MKGTIMAIRNLSAAVKSSELASIARTAKDAARAASLTVSAIKAANTTYGGGIEQGAITAQEAVLASGDSLKAMALSLNTVKASVDAKAVKAALAAEALEKELKSSLSLAELAEITESDIVRFVEAEQASKASPAAKEAARLAREASRKARLASFVASL
jgi:hypothetical protein